jgi:outer membrane protein assembly factor BamC
MKQLFNSVLLLVILAGVVACSSLNSDQKIDYRTSEITPTLEVPPDLVSRSSNRNLTLPGSKIGLPGNSGRYVETGNLNIDARTLPQFENIKINGEGDLYWLEVPDKAEKVYPVIRNFWLEQGFTLEMDEPAIGIMETNWLSLKSGSDSFLASFFESMAAAERKDQYKTRFERSTDNLGTRIYIAHNGQELVIDDANLPKSTVKFGRSQGWNFTPSDSFKEYEMLSRLMIFMGMQDSAVKAELEKIGLFAARAGIEYDKENEETFLQVKQGFQQTWNRLIHQMDRLSIPFIKQNKKDNEGSISIKSSALVDRIDQPAELSDNITLSLNGGSNSDNTRIDVLDDSGSLDQSDNAKKVMQFFQQQLK